jgi:hypothetical protein
MRALPIALLVLATAACGAYRFPSAPVAADGTVSGQVMVVPCAPIAPIEPAAQPCVSRPVSGLEIEFTGNGTTVAAQTDAKGYYSVLLPAGTWKVSFKGYMRIMSGPTTVTVNAGSHVVANYVVDSGIRVGVN